jgi:hypothetical protein
VTPTASNTLPPSPTPAATLVPLLPPSTLLGVQLFNGDERPVVRDQLAQAGIRWVRVPLLWRFIEPVDTQPPTYSWPYVDDLFINLIDAGLTPIVTVYNHPDWAATTDCGPIDRVPISRYQDFWRALVERYDGDGQADGPRAPRVRHWEVLNEPDFNPAFAGTEDDYGG